ncbi:hypothetical protein ACH3WN_00885 [Streptomyces albogriseolus]|uniref:hypothetical protein n=1 Tax=Streptomyces albogriseolus TaxID=1887 RepID=UPI00378F045B
MSSTPNVSDVSGVTPDGAAWLASAGTAPRGAGALWGERPDAPVVLPCGVVFDEEGPGSGPVAEYRGRMLLFGAVGTAQRLPALLKWEEWGAHGSRTDGVPPLLCHGAGDAVTVPAPSGPVRPDAAPPARWLVAPDSRSPWLPGPEVLLWAAVRAARAAVRISIFPPADRDANVYDVSRRR